MSLFSFSSSHVLVFPISTWRNIVHVICSKDGTQTSQWITYLYHIELIRLGFNCLYSETSNSQSVIVCVDTSFDLIVVCYCCHYLQRILTISKGLPPGYHSVVGQNVCGP